MVTSTVGPAGHTVSVEKEGRIVAQRLGGKVIGGSKEINSVIKAHTDHPEVQKFLKVSESVYDDRSWAKELMDTNPQASASAPSNKPAKGHYLMRGGRKLSGPHTPDEAVKAYKNLSSQGTDTKGVKIVHVKEAAESKVKKAAEKAISLAKKAKGTKHVDTKPSLDKADKGTGGPMETNQDGDNAKL